MPFQKAKRGDVLLSASRRSCKHNATNADTLNFESIPTSMFQVEPCCVVSAQFLVGDIRTELTMSFPQEQLVAFDDIGVPSNGWLSSGLSSGLPFFLIWETPVFPTVQRIQFECLGNSPLDPL